MKRGSVILKELPDSDYLVAVNNVLYVQEMSENAG